MKTGFMVSVAAALGLASMLVTAAAQEYPSRTVTIIVPYPAGGPTDETARMVAQSLSTQLKRSFIVEDIGGGGAIIGSEKVARAAPDGYTLLVHNLQIAANVSLYENLPFDTVKTFTPVMLINRNPLVLVGRESLEPSTLRDLVALMKEQTLKAAIPGYGTTGHLATSLFAQEAGASLDQIAAPAITDLLGGQVDLFFATAQSVVQQVATGALKAYGVTAKEKLPEFPTADSFPPCSDRNSMWCIGKLCLLPRERPALLSVRSIRHCKTRWPIRRLSKSGQPRMSRFSHQISALPKPQASC